ncbi:MAG: hypothetical protein ACT4QF_03465 [Sporichthyaceae bacterium]
MSEGSGEAVTVLVTRVVRPDREADFADWADELDGAAAEFPGHRASIRLQDGQGLNHLAYQFDTPENLRRWERSTRHRDLLQRGREYSDEQHGATGGRDTWFEVPSGAPERWKTFVLTWLAVYPALLVIATVLDVVAGDLPLPATLAISSALLTALLTWLILPRVERLARRWLLRGARPEHVERSDDPDRSAESVVARGDDCPG